MKQQNRLIAFGGGVATLLVSGLVVGFTSAPPILTSLIFVSNRSGIVRGTPNGNEIWTMDAGGGSLQRLTTNTWAEWEPQWNPAGDRIAFTSNQTGNYDVYTLDPNNLAADPVNLTNSPAYDFGATWSPDGSKIAFSSDRDNLGSGIAEIYVMNADGTGTPTNLTNSLGSSEGHSAWSRDGTKIAFFSTRNGNEEIYVMNANGSGQTRLTNNPATDNLPTWSPDGTKIAFTSYRTGGGDIYVMNANGSGKPTKLTNSTAEEVEPAWSPDGTKIVYYRRHDVENFEIYTMNADGTGQSRLTNNNPYLDADPTWKFQLP